MTTKLIKIGKSQGVRFTKEVLEKAQLEGDLQILVEKGQIIIRSAAKPHPRAGWDEQFKKALAELPPDFLEKEAEEWADWQNMPNDFDEKEWTW